LDYYRENGFIAKKGFYFIHFNLFFYIYLSISLFNFNYCFFFILAFQTPEEVQKVKLLTRSNGKELFYVLKNYA